jgi:hypothetical protein
MILIWYAKYQFQRCKHIAILGDVLKGKEYFYFGVLSNPLSFGLQQNQYDLQTGVVGVAKQTAFGPS